MKKLILIALASVLFSVTSFALTPITGATQTCIATKTSVGDTTAGGTWSSSNTAVATIGSGMFFAAIVTGVSAGTTTITYTLGGVYVTQLFTVADTLPAPITGLTGFCVGITSTLSDVATGGTWSSSDTYIASVGSGSGIVTGARGGSATIYYATSSGCYVATTVTVAPLPVVYIVGPSIVCLGSTVTLADTMGLTGGTWSSATTTVATIGSSTGIVTGLSLGTATISYTLTNACGSATATMTLAVINTTVPPSVITGASSVYVGANTTLLDAVPGGTWSSSNTAIATVDPVTGIITGTAIGSATITYTVSGCGGSADTTTSIAVTSFPGISGHILFTHGYYHGYFDTIKIWLITYDPATYLLKAVDSISVTSGARDTSVYYQFPSEPSDSFRIKAAINDTSGLSYGYIPTYHYSNFYWDSATVLYHAAGIGDVNQDINMLYGAITSGPGFIGGNVLLGANKGTSSSIPAIGLQMYCINATTGAIVQTTTDATGSYNFSSLPLGTYTIFPEALNYLTTPYTSITLTSSANSMTGASFIQHTISHTITPINTTAVDNIKFLTASVITYPNPTSGKLNIQWQEPTSEKATITITDVTGREISKATINMNQGSGSSSIDLSSLANGLYMISIKSAAINYNSKIQVQK